MPSIIPKITINGKESTEISGLMIVALPPITKPAMRAVAEEIDGRDGDQIEKLGFSAYDKTIRIALSGDYDVDDVIEYFNQDGIIIFSNEPDKYYHFKQLEGIDFEKLMRYKTADVVFHCQPFKFSTTEEEQIFSNPESVNITNSGNYFSKPEIVLTGKGNMEMSINDAPVLAIDFGDEEQTIAIDAQSMNAYGTKNNIKEAIFEINPSQDLHGYESAWLDSETPFKKPYNLINVAGTASRIGNSMIDKIVGGSFPFNQLIPDAKITVSITVAEDVTSNRWGGMIANVGSGMIGHKILGIDNYSNSKCRIAFGANANFLFDGSSANTEKTGTAGIWETSISSIGTGDIYFRLLAGLPAGTYTNKIQLFDLTQMLGSTIADYIYSLERATAGAGVAYFRALFPDDYYPYNAGELLSVKTSAHIMRNSSNVILANYPLDANLELRGIPQIDANGNLSYDGDEYTADGNVLRKYAEYIFTGSENWEFYSSELAFWHCSPLIINGITGTQNRCSNGIPITVSNNTQIRVYLRYNPQISESSNLNEIFANGTKIIYAVASPTTETAQPFASPQIVDASGSMEYVDARAVKIPVGHVSMYANNCEILGFTESNVSKSNKNLFDQDSVYSQFKTGENKFKGTASSIVSVKNSLADYVGETITISMYIDLTVAPVVTRAFIQCTINGTAINGSEITEGNQGYVSITVQPQTKDDLFCISYGSYASNYIEFGSIQIEKGSTATEFVEHVGKIIPVAWAVNQWDEEWEIGTYDTTTGEKKPAVDRIRNKNLIPVNPNTTYFIYCGNYAINLYGILRLAYDRDGNFLGGMGSNYTDTFITPNDCYYVAFSPNVQYGTEYNGDISINSPASDHNYHAYSDIPTAYKAQLIFLDGTWELRLLSKKINMGSLSWEKFDVAQGSLFRSNEIDVKKIQSSTEIPNVLCGLYPTVANAERANHSLSMVNNTAKIDVIDDGFDDVASFKTAMKNIDLEYEMQSPLSISLSADELTSLLGINNIWHDANGETQITFTKDGDVEHEISGMIATFYIDVDDLVFGVFKNRLIIGDYDKIQLKKGSNTISFAPIEEGSEISEMAIDFYSRWL